jgi:hypothetical protein
MAANVDFQFPSRFRRLLRRLRTYAGVVYRVDWLAMFIFARLEIVQKYAGRQRNPGSPLPHSGALSALLQTELPVHEIARRVRADGIAGGLRLSEDTVAKAISFAARAPCYGNGEPHRLLDRCPLGCLIPAEFRRYRRLRCHPAAVPGPQHLGDCGRFLGHAPAPGEVAAMVELPGRPRRPCNACHAFAG